MLITQHDYRLGNTPITYATNNQKDINMQIPDNIRKCVAFIAHLDKNDKIVLKGTGFFVSMLSDDQSMYFTYLVTARHVIANIIAKNLAKDNHIWIRINKKDGEYGYKRIHISQFIPHPDSVDIMVTPILPDPIYDFLSLPHTMFLTQNAIDSQQIGLGDDVFMTGLFVRHAGKERNTPIVRIGNISAMPEEQVYSKAFGNMDAYLIELRSLGGLSGSPVFLYLANPRIIKGNSTILHGGHQFYLLGLLHGHWDLHSATQDVVTEDYQQENKDKINTGIGIAVPAMKILETLNQPSLKEPRDKAIQEEKDRTAPTED